MDQYILELVEGSRRGDKKSMEFLADYTQDRLSGYIYRLTLDHDLAQDILQETMLEMVQSIKKLRDAEKFWPWIFRTALGKVQHHFRDKKREQARLTEMEKRNLLKYSADDFNDGLNGMIRKELAQAIFKSMGKLSLKYRNVIALRCFEQLSFVQIADMMNLKTELQARVMFFRAKKALQKNLTHQGFNNKILITALSLFAFFSAQSKITASAAVIKASILDVGPIASGLGFMTSKAGVAVGSAVTGLGMIFTVEDVIYLSSFLVIYLFCFAFAGLFSLGRR